MYVSSLRVHYLQLIPMSWDVMQRLSQQYVRGQLTTDVIGPLMIGGPMRISYMNIVLEKWFQFPCQSTIILSDRVRDILGSPRSLADFVPVGT